MQDFEDDGLGCDGMNSVMYGLHGYTLECFGCARPHRETVERCRPATHAVTVDGYQHPQKTCLHRIHLQTVDPVGVPDKPIRCGGVDDTTPLVEGVPA